MALPSVRNRARLIVGIDYGTTYSGISFALSTASDFKDIHPWTKYPGSSSHSSEHCEKAPSRVALASENLDLDQNAWGYQIEPGMTTYAWTKLLLDNSALAGEYDDPSLEKTTGNGLLRLPSGMTAKDVVTEYFRGLNHMFQDAIKDSLGGGSLDDMPMDFWLTVPATWTEAAKILTHNAALDAGFASRDIDSLSLIPEPEAAAQMALKSSIHQVENFVECGTGVMICDCGGGTVDITTYEVQKTTPQLKLREICVGVGGKCGGTYVDRNLCTMLEARFGEAFTSLGPEHFGPGSDFMDSFELKKRDFSMKAPSRRPIRLFLPIPGLPDNPELDQYYDRRFSSILLTQADMKSLFDPVIEKILGLVNNQVDEVEEKDAPTIRTLVLVGGFAASPYLRSRLSTWCYEYGIRLTMPLTGSWSAVVCGAVLRGLEGSVVSQKKSRRHYGFRVNREFVPGRHEPFDKTRRRVYRDNFLGVDRLTGFMEWGIGKGDIIDETTEISNFYTATVTEDRLSSPGPVTLYSCSLDAAPKTIESPRLEEVGEIRYAIKDLDTSQFKSLTTRDGTTHYKIPWTLNIRLGDESGLLVFRVFCQEREIGKACLAFSST